MNCEWSIFNGEWGKGGAKFSLICSIINQFEGYNFQHEVLTKGKKFMENSQDFTLGFLLGAITIMVGYAIGKRLKRNLNNRQRFFIWAVVVVIHAWLNLGPLHISKVYVIPSVIFFLSIFYLDFDNREVTPQASP